MFYTTSQVTNSGFNINTEKITKEIILSLWIAIIQNIGAVYTLLLFIFYSNLFLSRNFLVLSKLNIIRLYFFIFIFFINIFFNIFF